MSDALFLAAFGDASPGSRVTVTGDEGRHAAVVKRIELGESVLLSDGHGRAVRGPVVEVSKQGIVVEVAEVRSAAPQRHRWVGVQALAKGDRSDLAVETMTELGIDEVLAWQASRSIVRWTAEKSAKGLAKWAATAREATKQSRRFRIPEVGFVTTKQLVARIQQRREGVVDRLLATVGDQHLGRLHGIPRVALRLGDDRGLEVGQAAGGGVAVVDRVARRLGRHLHDVVGGREVGLTGPEADHRATLRLQRLGLCVDRQGGGLGDRTDALGDTGPGLCRLLAHGSIFAPASGVP